MKRGDLHNMQVSNATEQWEKMSTDLMACQSRLIEQKDEFTEREAAWQEKYDISSKELVFAQLQAEEQKGQLLMIQEAFQAVKDREKANQEWFEEMYFPSSEYSLS